MVGVGVAGTGHHSGAGLVLGLNPFCTAVGNIFQLLSQVDLGVVLADPSCIEAVVKQKVLINRNSVLFWVRTGGKEV